MALYMRGCVVAGMEVSGEAIRSIAPRQSITRGALVMAVIGSMHLERVVGRLEGIASVLQVVYSEWYAVGTEDDEHASELACLPIQSSPFGDAGLQRSSGRSGPSHHRIRPLVKQFGAGPAGSESYPGTRRPVGAVGC